ncbi:MAG: cysteine hydrolase [Clostridiales bacterium]|jgi:nicotinamidase-related amidase|nr:cysteine hydrolase [Clostridiales bacterium]
MKNNSGNILIVVDMQNDFIDGSLGTAEARQILENVRRKIEKYKRENGRIIFTRDTHYDNYLETQEGRNLPVKHCIKDTGGWQISDKLSTEGALIWDKKSFGSPELAQFIKDEIGEGGYGGYEIELVGLCTDICVISNALILKAFLPEVKLKVDSSCCAGVTNASHLNALEAMKMCQVNVV